MRNAPYGVFVVLDGEYGTRLSPLVVKGPILVSDTPINRAVAQSFWNAFPDRDHLDGITVFTSKNSVSTEESLLYEIDTIDMHHNAYSADPPYTVLEIIGTPLTAKIESELSRYGFDEFLATAEGFRAVRPLSSTATAR
jgi:hypothetical protein